MHMGRVDAVIVGAGIAGASLASCLPPAWRVLLVERETQAGFHTTGRSAAIFSSTYGAPSVRALSRATRPFLDAPPPGFTDHALLHRCGAMFIARDDQRAKLESFATVPDVRVASRMLTAAEAVALHDGLRPDYVAGALLEEDAAEIDVHALHQGFLRQARANGVELRLQAEVASIDRSGRGWRVATASFTVDADIVVNAAGAWADQVAQLAGIGALGVTPLRRTVVVVDAPPGLTLERWPFVVDIDEEFYFKADAGRVLLSPADETPSPPCDAQPDEMDIAIAIERVEAAAKLQVRRIVNRWAGLRCFAPDRKLVIGEDPRAPGFFWLAGQGGYGIQTAYGAATLAASLLKTGRGDAALEAFGLVLDDVLPGRLLVAAC